MTEPVRYKKVPPSNPVFLAHYAFALLAGKVTRLGRAANLMLRASETIKTYERLLKEAGIPIPKRTD